MITQPDAEKRKKRETGIQVIARAANILRLLKNNPSGMSLTQIANRLNLPRSTVQRIVGSLQDEQFIMTENRGGSIRLGPGIRELGANTQFDIVEQCRQYLLELTRETGETTDLSTLRGGVMVFLDQVPGTHRLRTISSIGEIFPLTTTANGRACLAALPRSEAINLIKQEWNRNGITGDIDHLEAKLDDIAEMGFAFDIDEHTHGISAIGFAFRDKTGELSAISVPVPTSRFIDKRPEIENAIRKTAEKIKSIF